MRNTHIDLHDALDRALVAIGNDYPAGHLLDAHAHRRAQLLYGATGVMLVLSEDGGWVVPPQRASGSRPASRTRCGCWGQHAQHRAGAARGRAGLRSGGGVAAVAPAAAGGRGHAGAVRQGRARRRAGPTAAARGGPRAGAAAASRCRATRLGALCQAYGGAGHPLAAAGLGRAAAHESAQLQPPFPRAHRHVLRPRRQRACVVLALARWRRAIPSPSSRWISATRARPRSQRCSGACWARRSAYLRTD